MDLVILNENRERLGIIDEFESLIWSERYYECGDFEVLTYPNQNNIILAVQGHYISIEESERLMIIEDVHIVTDPVDGNKLVIKGRSIEIVLDRRIIWNPVVFENMSLQDCILNILTENAFDPYNAERHISILDFEASTDPYILGIVVKTQFWGESLYNAVVDLCFSNKVGFKITLTEENRFLFKLYAGVDRSYEQTENPYVIFSPNFENLKNSTYISTDKLYKTVSLTRGEKGVGNSQIAIEVLINDGTDMARREMLLDAQDVSKVDQEGNPIPDETYIEHLYQRGREELSKRSMIQSFSSEIDPIGTFVYGEDFFLGDIVQVSNEYGIENRSRTIELVRSQDKSGIIVYPIFNLAPSPLIVNEYITFRKFLTIAVNPQSKVNYEKFLGISIDTEVAEEYFEAVGFYKKLNILTQIYENISLIKYNDIFVYEEISTKGVHETVILRKYSDFSAREDEVSSKSYLSKRLDFEISEDVFNKGIYESVILRKFTDFGVYEDEISSKTYLSKRLNFETKAEVT